MSTETDYAISFCTDLRDPTKYNALVSLPGEYCWRYAHDATGQKAKFDTPAEAEARAGHYLARLLNLTRPENNS